MSGPISDTIKLGPAPSSMEGVPGPGEVIAGKYRVESVLGVGGMGVVLAVRHITLGELYAMKFLLPKGAQDGEAVARFMREAKAAVRIKSEHIARVNDFGTLESGSPYIVMEHLEGMDLSELRERHGPQAPVVATDYVIQACAGLAEAHQLGIVHRDLKPSNLFLTRRADGTPLVKILDFGISKAAADSALPAITATHETFGSPAYMSPEQIRSAKNVDARSDVFSLGVILFELLTARLPFEGETSGGLLAAISADAPLRLSDVLPDANGELEAAVARCLQKRPGDRFQSVGALASALAPFASQESQSLVQRIGRIGSPSNVPPPMSVAPPSSRASQSGPNAKLAAAAATERPWTTRPKESSGKRSALLVLAGALVAGIAASGYVFLVRPTQGDSAGSNGAPAAVTAIPTLPPQTRPLPAPSERAALGDREPPLTPAPSAATLKPAMDSVFSSPRATVKGKPATRPTPSASAAPVVSAAPSAKPAVTSDPTAESH